MHSHGFTIWRSALLVLPLLVAGAVGQQTGLLWSTYLGGSGREIPAFPHHMTATANGDILVWGTTTSTDFPTTPGAYQANLGGVGGFGFGDGFIARLTPDGSGLVWATYLGGSRDDSIQSVVVDANGTVTVCGMTDSMDFPTTPGAYQSGPPRGVDAFVARFVWDGRQLSMLWSTLLGDLGTDSGQGLALHPDGRVVVSGFTTSFAFPMQGTPYQGSNGGQYDAFLAVLDSTGENLLASTYLGGSGVECSAPQWYPNHLLLGASLHLDAAGNPVLVHLTSSRNLPTTTGAFQSGHGGGFFDGFVARLNIGLSQLIYSSYLGGNEDDFLWSSAMAPGDRIAVCMPSRSSNLSTTPGAYQRTYNGSLACTPGGDGYVAIIDTRQSGAAQLVWATYLGGTGCDNLSSVALDRCGRVVVSGAIFSSTLPVTPGAVQPTNAGGWDSYVACLDPRQQGQAQLVYSTYFGGVDNDGASSSLDGKGNVILIVNTSGSIATTPGCFQPAYGGGTFDAFVAKLNLLPEGVTRYGRSTPACLHPIYQTVDSWPVPGNTSFTLQAAGAPPDAFGLLAFGTPNTTSWKLLSFLDVFLNPSMLAVVAVTADPNGCAEHMLSMPSNLTPAFPPYGMATQWFFLTSATCPGSGPAASSEGLAW